MEKSQKYMTFVLPPGFNFSGGARVTVEMANRLITNGFNTRIIYKRTPLLSLTNLKQIIKLVIIFSQFISNKKKNNWLKDFKGKMEPYNDINKVTFARGEFVIAVGLMTVQDVSLLNNKHVHKIRYCHGMQEQDQELMKQAWSPLMDTITVSQQLVPRIRQLTQSGHIEVIPNGINLSDYFIENQIRDGIGTIYNRNQIKNPAFIEQLMINLKKNTPAAQQYLFGIDKKPKDFSGYYYRFPAITKARELYNRCKIWIIASRSEGFSLPILEAMACGCAVISTEHQGSIELIQHGINGFIVPVGNLTEFLKYINLLWHNEEQRLFIVNNGLATVKKYDWDTSVNKMVKYLVNHKMTIGEQRKN